MHYVGYIVQTQPFEMGICKFRREGNAKTTGRWKERSRGLWKVPEWWGKERKVFVGGRV